MVAIFCKLYFDLIKFSKYTVPLISLNKSKAFCSSLVSSQLKDYRFCEKHEWVKLSDNIATIGISNYAQTLLGTIVFVQLPEINTYFQKDVEVGCIESTKSANDIYAPLSGTVIEVNNKLESQPDLINRYCYDEGWIYKLHIDNKSEFNALMTQNDYQKFLKGLEQ